MSRCLLATVLCLGAGVFGPGCSSQDPLERFISELDEPALRERAVDGLVRLCKEAPPSKREGLRRRVVGALGEAYRVDTRRGAIVAALALLRASEAEEVFAAALRDFERGGDYFEAAIRSARMLGELGLKARVPDLVNVLNRALLVPREDRNTWLERTIIQALNRLGDRRAVPVLVKVLQREPSDQDFHLNKLAARTLGQLGDPAAAPALAKALGATQHGLLLFEESRRALCRLGAPAASEMLRAAKQRDRRGRPSGHAAAALGLLADLGRRDFVSTIQALPTDGAGEAYQLALVEALLRLGDDSALTRLVPVIDDEAAPLTARRRAAELFGLYGQDALALVPSLETICARSDGSSGVLCWSLALAFTRLSDASGASVLDRLATLRRDRETPGYLTRYRQRLLPALACLGKADCLARHLSAPDWRVRERAVQELGRLGQIQDAPSLAGRLLGEHPQVQRAILTVLERMTLDAGAAARVFRALPDDAALRGKPAPVPDLRSRTFCLRQRLSTATSGGQP